MIFYNHWAWTTLGDNINRIFNRILTVYWFSHLKILFIFRITNILLRMITFGVAFGQINELYWSCIVVGLVLNPVNGKVPDTQIFIKILCLKFVEEKNIYKICSLKRTYYKKRLKLSMNIVHCFKYLKIYFVLPLGYTIQYRTLI